MNTNVTLNLQRVGNKRLASVSVGVPSVETLQMAPVIATANTHIINVKVHAAIESVFQ